MPGPFSSRARVPLRRLMLLSLLVVAYAAFAAPAAQAQTAPPPGCGPDSDCDGIPDTSDQCPSELGGGPSGCPDRDGDRVPDKDDACPDERGEETVNAEGQQMPGACPDEDRDGVRDTEDSCPHTFGLRENPDSRGCGPFSTRATLDARDTNEMRRDPGIHTQCENSAGDSCTVRVTLTLSRTSARRLGLKRKILDTTLRLTKTTFAGRYRYLAKNNVLSTPTLRAFKRAYLRNIPVTMTLSGSYVRGSGPTVRLPRSTFTMKSKPQGGGAYRLTPSVTNGDDGPSSGGLTRQPRPDDS